MSGNKRQRELARAKYERQQARRGKRVDKRRRNQRIIAAVVVVALVLGTTAWIVLSKQSGAADVQAIASALPNASTAASSSAVAPSASTPASAAASTVASAAPSGSGAPSAEAALLDCREPGTPRPDDKTYDAAGTAAGTSITFATNCGDIVVELNPAAAATVASEAFLAKDGFYDNTSCHRLTTSGIYVLQCGDPKGDGTGGPGYTVPDENLPAAGANNYPAGTVAMANSGPGTSGSQFFIVYADTTLPGDYTIWGTVTSGLDIVKEVASAGVADGSNDGAPKQPVFIESATVQSN